MRQLVTVLIALLTLTTWHAPVAAATRTRVALVIGNSAYDRLPALKNPKRDAAAVADRLRDLGFSVSEVLDGDTERLNRSADRFVENAHEADLAVFYFAGHGVQLFDRNYLVGVDVDADHARRADDFGLDLTRFLTRLRGSGAIRVALLIDACRNNPLSFDATVKLLAPPGAPPGAPAAAASSVKTRGLGRVDLAPAPKSSAGGALLFFAAQPGQVSYDGEGANSFFAEGLKEGLAKADRPLGEVFRGASAYVRTVTRGDQVPQMVSDWTSDVALGARDAAKIDYDFYGGDRALSEAERKAVIRRFSGYSKFRGDFIARAAIGESADPAMSEADQKKASALGSVGGVSLSYDIARKGRPQTLHVYFQQTRYYFVVEDEGVRSEIDSCLDGAEAKNVEIALRDVNGDRRPEVWIAFEEENTIGWGTFCILEYRGLGELGPRRRGNTVQQNDAFLPFRTLLRGNAGWNVVVATDGTIQVCGGSFCASSWKYRFEGEQARLLETDGAPPTGADALPFRDEPERAAHLYEDLRRHAGSVQVAQAWSAATRTGQDAALSARLGAGGELTVGCRRGGSDRAAATLSLSYSASGNRAAQSGELPETFRYGENLARVPLVVEEKRCPLIGLSRGDKGYAMEIAAGAEGEACLAALATARLLTLPLSQGGGLIRIRLPSNGGAMDVARRVCRGDTPVPAPSYVPVPQSTLPSEPPQGAQPARQADPKAQVLRFLSGTYFAAGERDRASIERLYTDRVAYFGKPDVPNRILVADKLRYYSQWPDRRYVPIPETIAVKPRGAATSSLQVAFEYRYQLSGPKGTRSGRGLAELELVPRGETFIISSEGGRVLGRE